MGDPRNPARREEQWDEKRVRTLEEELRAIVLGQAVAVSGGWAWHFMSPPHAEYKMLHDHKDVDLLVDPEYSAELFTRLKERGYEKIWTKYDRVSNGQFLRYEKHVFVEGTPVKVLLDVFLEKVPYVVAGGVRVVEPKTLLGFYDRKQHTTDDCVAVVAARTLLKQGISPVGRPELIKFP